VSEPDRILVAVLDRTVYVKPVGCATQRNCLGLPDFLKDMFAEGCSSVAFDMSQCSGMDSTFLGVIAAAALSGVPGPPKTVAILNASEQLVRELRMVGLLEVVSLRQEPCTVPDGLELAEVDFVHLPANERQRLERIRDLHQRLVSLNEKNKRNFGPFVEMLNKELAQQ